MKILLIGIVSILVQFGLAIAGWGGVAPFFSHVPFVAMAVVTAVLVAASPFSGGNFSAGEREDRGNRWVFGAIAVLALLLAYFPAYCDRRNIWTIDGEAMRWTGIVIFTIGGVLRLWPVFVLGNRFERPRRNPEKSYAGDDRHIPLHPQPELILGLLMGSLGWALVFRSSVGVVITLLLLIPLIGRMDAEERLLAGQFGDAYENYRARSWRLIPWIY